MSTSFPNDSAGSNSEQPSNSGNSSGDRSQPKSVKLRDLLPNAVFVGAEDIEAKRVVHRADECRAGDVFVPQHTANRDEHDRVEEAIQNGAVAVVAERLLPVSIPQCLVEDTQETYGVLCQQLAGCPSDRMLTIAVVGSAGKTTTALFVSSMLKSLGGAVAYSTSLGVSNSERCDRLSSHPASAEELAKWLQDADLAGSPAAVIELSPAMLRNQVSAGVEFDLVILTGMRGGQSRNALSARNYASLLDRLLAGLKSHGMLLYNADDAQAALWAQRSEVAAISYGFDGAEHVRAKRLSRNGGEQQFLAMTGNMLMPVTLPVPGDHAARCALAAVATAWMFDFSVPRAIAGIEKLKSIPGRMQRISSAVEVPVFVDAADTPDRLAVAVHALRQHHLGPATVVMDLDNSLDPKWRQRLGEVLDKSAQKVVLTGSGMSPEAVQSMAMDVLGGFESPGQVNVIPDREAAIHWAVNRSNQGSILLAGRGQASWLNREGEPLTDEMIATAAVAAKNTASSAPALAIFPPSDPEAFFPIDS